MIHTHSVDPTSSPRAFRATAVALAVLSWVATLTTAEKVCSVAMIALIGLLFMFRYEITPINPAIVIQKDRWTGTTTRCRVQPDDTFKCGTAPTPATLKVGDKYEGKVLPLDALDEPHKYKVGDKYEGETIPFCDFKVPDGRRVPCIAPNGVLIRPLEDLE